MTKSKDAAEVARRCLCLELLFQRFVLETEADDPAAEREKARQMWLSREGDLGIASALFDGERVLLATPVGELSEDQLDDVHGRASGALVLLWALGRLDKRPSFTTVNEMEIPLSEHGLLGDGSIARARTAAEGASLRPQAELDEALSAYLRSRGKAREVSDPDRIFAEVAAHHLTWIADSEMPFEDDITIDD